MDALERLLADLRTNASAYLNHEDMEVRIHTRATMDAYKIRADGASGRKPESHAHIYLGRLYRRLHKLSAA